VRPRLRPRLVHRLSPFQWLISGALALFLLALPVSYTVYRLDLRPAAGSGSVKEFQVATGDNAPKIADHLEAAGLIRNRNAFITYINLHGLRPRLQAGTYLITPTDSAASIAEELAGGKTVTKRLVVPEGYRLSQIETEAASIGIDETAFKAALAAPHTQSFLAGKPADVDLEGYLFPDSYQISPSTTPDELVNAMLNNFGKRVGPEYVQAFQAEGLTLHQGLTIASIVEREVNIAADRPIVAQIFLKRFRTGMPLGSSVTACYAYSLQTGSSSCNENSVANIQSPYNTLIHPGLPPGPISSPGLSSLDAVAHPASTDYLYFITDKDHVDRFAHTYAEHQANIAKYGLVGS
jgi:UPF0755 protein